MPQKPTILIICDYYLPGFESGGALRTLVNMVDRLGDRFDFRIITRDHDGPHKREPYSTVKIGHWNRVGNAKVYYIARDQIRSSTLIKLINAVSPDAIYLNSFFSRLTIRVLSLLKFRRIRNYPIILAPEGEFSPGALTLKPIRKQLYLTQAKLLGLLGNCILKAASESEKLEIEKVLGSGLDIYVAPNMPPSMINDDYDQSSKPTKAVGKCRMVFLSRFMRKKNFNWLLEQLRDLDGELSIDVYGTIEDIDYWDECQRISNSLPSNIVIEAKGPLAHENVSSTLAGYDFFVLPTLGENFGHVFIEAMASGCPLVISDRTPWRDLEQKNLGWDLSLEEPDAWKAILNKCIGMDNAEYQTKSAAARAFAVKWLSDPEIEGSNVEMIEAALKRSKS